MKSIINPSIFILLLPLSAAIKSHGRYSNQNSKSLTTAFLTPSSSLSINAASSFTNIHKKQRVLFECNSSPQQHDDDNDEEANSSYALFKPDGYLSQFINNGQIKKRQKMLGELLPLQNMIQGEDVDTSTGKKLMPVGRLDEMSEGLLILTTNGHLSYHITSHHQSDNNDDHDNNEQQQQQISGTEKEYHVQLNGIITPEAISMLQHGVVIRAKGKEQRTNPCVVTLLRVEDQNVSHDSLVDVLPARNKPIRQSSNHGPTCWISVVIKEGKNRQIRRMTAAVGFPTLRLVRVRIGPVRLWNEKGTGLMPGCVRKLTEDELEGLWLGKGGTEGFIR